VVRVVTLGETPRQPFSTEVPMRLIGLAVILPLSLILPPLAARARPADLPVEQPTKSSS